MSWCSRASFSNELKFGPSEWAGPRGPGRYERPMESRLRCDATNQQPIAPVCGRLDVTLMLADSALQFTSGRNVMRRDWQRENLKKAVTSDVYVY